MNRFATTTKSSRDIGNKSQKGSGGKPVRKQMGSAENLAAKRYNQGHILKNSCHAPLRNHKGPLITPSGVTCHKFLV